MCNESSSRRRVIVEVKPSCINLVLKELTDLTTPIKVELDIEDSGKIYKKLSTLDGVVDWEFKEEEPLKKGAVLDQSEASDSPLDMKSSEESLDDVYKKESDNIVFNLKEEQFEFPQEQDNSDDKTSEKGTVDLTGSLSNVADLYYLLNISSTKDIANFIQACWTVIKLHPAVRYNTNLFVITAVAEYKRIKEEEGTFGFETAASKAMQKMVIDLFYNTPNSEDEIREAFLDTTIRIGQRWNSLKSVNTLTEVLNVLYKFN